MSSIFIGYGEYKGYQVKELPNNVLNELAIRYPFSIADKDAPEYDELLITVAVHGELERRRNGGTQAPRVPTFNELVDEIIVRGYQQASKQHHPDGIGNHEAQIRLTQARDALKNVSSDIMDDTYEAGATIIPAPSTPRSQASTTTPFSDDDMPF